VRPLVSYRKDFLADLYRTLYTIRVFETRCIALYHRNHIRGYLHPYLGEEAIAVGVCAALRKQDYIASTHRGHGHCIARGGDLKKMVAEITGKAAGYCHGHGGSMHIANIRDGNLGANGIVGAGIPIGVGAALGASIRGDDRVTAVFSSDGAACHGTFGESLNLAAAWKLPMILVVENNQYAVSTPIAAATAEPELYKRGIGYGVYSQRVDGNDVLTMYEKTCEAVERCRAGHGPVLLEAMTYRHGGHHVNDPGKYMPTEQVEYYQTHDPCVIGRRHLMEQGGASEKQVKQIEAAVEQAMQEAIDFALASAEPDVAEFLAQIDIPPTAPRAAKARSATAADAPVIDYRTAIRDAIAEEMRRDPAVFIMGEGIAERGGSFKATVGLLDEFGPKRVIDTPLAEASFTGAGVGAAITGMRPIVEILFIDFSVLVLDQIINQAAKFKFMTGGQGTVPFVLRTQGGSGTGVAAQHSQSLEALYYHIPGLKVVCPSTPADAKGLLKAAIRDDDPVIFIEHKKLYLTKGPCPAGEHVIELGVGDIKRTGKDATIIAWSHMVLRSLAAAETLAAEGIDVEVVDPRTLVPLDKQLILDSVRKTQHVVIVQEAVRRGGVASDIASIIQAEAFDDLDGPIQIVAGKNTPIPYNERLEAACVPQEEDIVAAVRRAVYAD